MIFSVLPGEVKVPGDPVIDDAAIIEIFGQSDGVADGDDIHPVRVAEILHLHNGNGVGDAAVGAKAVDRFVLQGLTNLSFAAALRNFEKILAFDMTSPAARAPDFVCFPRLRAQCRGDFIAGKYFR